MLICLYIYIDEQYDVIHIYIYDLMWSLPTIWRSFFEQVSPMVFRIFLYVSPDYILIILQ